MRKRNNVLLFSLVATAIYVLIGLLKQSLPSHRFLFVCFFLYSIMLPGFLAALRFSPWTKDAVRVLASFIFGAMIAYVILFVAALFRLDVRVYGFVAPAIVLALSFWQRASPVDSGGGKCTADPRSRPRIRMATAFLIVLVVAVSLMIMRTGDPLFYTSDSPDHIAYIRTISRTHEAFPDQFYYRDGGILTHDIRKGMGQVLWGAVNALTGRDDVAAVWPIMSLISSVLVIIALFCAGLLLFESAWIGLIAAILFVLFYSGGLREYHLARGAAGYLFGRVFYIAAVSFLPLAVARRRPGYMLLAVASAIAAGMTHVVHFVVVVFIAAVFVLSDLLGSRGNERIRRFRQGLVFCAVVILGSLPYLAFRYFRDYAPNNPLHTHVQGVLYLTHKFYCLTPLVYFQVAGPLGILAAVSLVVLWKKSSSVGYARLLFTGMIAVYVLLFCPLSYPFLLEKMSYLLIRFELAIPSMLVCAYLLRELWGARRRGYPGISPLGAGVAAVAAIVLLGVPLVKTSTGFAYSGHALDRAREVSYRNLEDLFTAMNRSCPPGSVVASDPITSFGIPAFTDDFVICPYDQHATPNDSTAIERISDCRRIFEPTASLTEIRGILAKYGAEYLVVNGRIPPSVETMYWKPDRATARALSERLREPSSPFRIVFERGDVTMARLVACPTCKAIREVSPEAAYVGDSLAAEAALRLRPAGVPGIRIASVRPSREDVARGDTITVNITWVATEKSPFSSYVAFLRFDTAFPKNALYARAYGKPYRKIVERITGRRFRFRQDFQPLGGIAPPDTWPSLREIHDRVQVEIPSDIASGTYTVSLKMAEKPQYPNYVLGDILTDDDVYNGPVMTNIRVR